MTFIKYVTQDWDRNRGYTKGKMLTFFFRISNYGKKNKFLKFVLLPYLAFYKLFVEWFLGIEIPYQTKIGKGLKIYHGIGLIINRNTVIGINCLLRHSTTIGNKGGIVSDCPVIGNNVDIGAHVCILGKITIGDYAVIGAGSIVTKDVPPHAIIAGNPGKIIRFNSL